MLAAFLSILESEGDKRRFCKIFEEYHGMMEQYAIHILREQHDAEDAVQNAFIQVIRHFEKIHSIPCEELQYWLISIVKNEARMILRKRVKTVEFERMDDLTWKMDSILDYRDLVALFRELPETYRSVLEMKLISGYSDREIAERMGISETAVSTRASRGRAMLRELVRREGMYP